VSNAQWTRFRNAEMSAAARLLARTVIETVLMIAGWAFLIASVVVAITGQVVIAGVLFIGSVIAFFAHSRSFKSKPSSTYMQELHVGGRR